MVYGPLTMDLNMKLNLDKQESEFLNKAISQWEENHLIDASTGQKLRESYEIKGFDWMRLAKYSFWIALICGAIAVGSLIIDVRVLNWIKNLYYTPDIVISIASGIISAVLLLFWQTIRKRNTPKEYSATRLLFLPAYCLWPAASPF